MPVYRVVSEYKAVVRVAFVIEAPSLADAGTMNGPIVASGREIDLIGEPDQPRTYKIKNEQELVEALKRLFVKRGTSLAVSPFRRRRTSKGKAT